MNDQQAIERYRYMLRTSPPDDIERAHAEAFAQLTPEQRTTVLRELSQLVPPSEVPSGTDPASLARLATRAEMRQRGTMEQTFSRVPAGPGMGGIFFATLAGAFAGTAIAAAFFGDHDGADAAAGDAGTGGDVADTGGDYGGDSGVDSGGDFGGDFGF